MTDSTDSVTADTLPPSGSSKAARVLDIARHNKEFGRFWRFAVVGVIGAVIDFGVYTTLNALGWLAPVSIRLPFRLTITGLGAAGAIAFVMAVSSNFIWNRFWTYPDSRSKPVIWQLATFFAVNVVGIFIRIPIIELATRPLGSLARQVVPRLSSGAANWFGESASWAIAVVIVMFWNFFVNRYWTYNDVS